MKRLRSGATVIAVAASLLFGLAIPVFAQFDGADAQIPENAPKNWSIQFLAWPLLTISVITLVVIVVYYMVKMIRLRYPAQSKS